MRLFVRLIASQLSVNDELMWDNGTAFPEPCIDRIADTVGKVGLGFGSLTILQSIVFVIDFGLNGTV